MSVRIRLFGKEYWFLGNSLDDEGSIAPLHHCDESGEVVDLETAFRAHSFAHYFPEEGIFRYQEKIGDRDDIEVIGKWQS